MEVVPMPPNRCLKCTGDMVEGYLKPSRWGVPWPEWVSGVPLRGFFNDLRESERDIRRVRTYRCIRCGFLESYASEPAV
jgi:hypothetical protein